MASQKILIVDDEPFNIEYLEQELEDMNFEILSAVNGQEALEKVQSLSPDLILLDIMMPVMDGFEVLSRLKSNPAMHDIPVIVISANNNLHSVVKGIQLGAEDYLPKPFEPVLLHARISSCLEKKRLRDLQALYTKSLEKEMDIARDIQQGFLPALLPEPEGWEIAAYFKAAREVAGDFYDAFLLPDGNLVCVVGDVCGKGVGAALFMTLFRSLIRASSTTDHFLGKKPSGALAQQERLQHVISFTNEYIAGTHAEAGMFATVFIGIFDLQDGTLSYINCGNEPPLILGDGSPPVPLPPTGSVIGVIPGAQYMVKQVTLSKEQIFLAFTDGIPDALNQEGISFGNDFSMKPPTLTGLSATSLVTEIKERLDRFIGGADQFDDITLLAVRRKP